MRGGRLFLLSSPSGGGKTSIGKALLKRIRGLTRPVSVTTRRPRRGERSGRDYLFVSGKTFQVMRRQGELLEWTTYNGHSYGTPRRQVEEALKEGKDLLLLLDVHGTLGLKRRFRKATSIFIMPPSFQDLVTRLRHRRTEGKGEVLRRLRIAKRELTSAKRYDHIVVNDRLTTAIRAVEQLIRTIRDRDRR